MSLSKRLQEQRAGQPERTWKLRPEVLLSPNIPKPMHCVCPRDILGRNWWNKTRKEAYKSTEYHCIACGVHKSAAKSRQWLEGHELYETDYAKGRHKYIETVPLCHFCHNGIHTGRLRMLLDSGKIHQAKYVAILQHKDRILSQAKLIMPLPYDGPIAEWSKWRLILNGKLYPPKFKSYEEWEQAMKSFNNQMEVD